MPSYAGIYLAAHYGMPSFDYDKLDDSTEKVSGSDLGVDLGFRLSSWVGLETGYSNITFEKYEDSLAGNTLSTEQSYTNINYGLRLFLGRFFTIKFGALSSSYKLDLQGTGIFASFSYYKL